MHAEVPGKLALSLRSKAYVLNRVPVRPVTHAPEIGARSNTHKSTPTVHTHACIMHCARLPIKIYPVYPDMGLMHSLAHGRECVSPP